jgi:hypothetical protein
MKKQLFTLALLFFAQLCPAMQPAAPLIQNRTIIVPTRGTNASPYQTPISGQLGPVQAGIPPYTFQMFGQHPGVAFSILPDGQFWIAAFRLPVSFQYTVTDSQGQVSAPATIRIEPGANLQEETPSLSESEPG